jgi:hypothetical protein
LLDELPTVPVTLAGVPDELQWNLFGAFALVIRYDKRCGEAEVSVTLSDRLAGSIHQAPESGKGAPEGANILPMTLPLSPTLPGGRE